MSHIKWKPEWETGNQFIDAQHKQLIELANVLDDSIQVGKESAVAEDAFDALLLYTKQHFSDEEKYWRQVIPERLDDHRQKHQALIDEINVIAYEGSKTTNVGRLIAEWVKSRLIPHMVDEDQKIIRSLG